MCGRFRDSGVCARRGMLGRHRIMCQHSDTAKKVSKSVSFGAHESCTGGDCGLCHILLDSIWVPRCLHAILQARIVHHCGLFSLQERAMQHNSLAC